MSEETNQWRKRLTTLLPCPSGKIPTVRRPGPDLALKAGKIARILQRQDQSAANDINKQLQFIETLPDDELDKLMSFARVLLTDVVIEPHLNLRPQEHQLSPDDLPLPDFWYIFSWAMNGGPDMPVKLKEGETTVETVSNFPSGQDSGGDTDEDSPPM